MNDKIEFIHTYLNCNINDITLQCIFHNCFWLKRKKDLLISSFRKYEIKIDLAIEFHVSNTIFHFHSKLMLHNTKKIIFEKKYG